VSKRILILGGGFAGILAARKLRGRGAEVRLIDRGPFSEFAPLLPDLLSGRVRGDCMRADLASVCRDAGAEFVWAEVLGIRPEKMAVETDAGEFSADAMILAIGCETNFFGSKEMENGCAGLKSVAEGRGIHRRAVKMLEGGGGTFLVVGGGYTGFEIATHMAVLAHRVTGLPYGRLADLVRIEILELGEEPLAGIRPKAKEWAVAEVQRYGIRLRTRDTVEGFEPDGAARLKSGRTVPDALVVWTAGVTPGPALAAFERRVSRGRLEVDEHLRVAGCERIFAAGDVAGPRPGGRERPLRMSVQFSRAGGACAARNALAALEGRPPRRFDPLDPGYLVPLATGKAAGVVMGLPVRGRLALGMHYGLCVFRTWRWADRLGILRDLACAKR